MHDTFIKRFNKNLPATFTQGNQREIINIMVNGILKMYATRDTHYLTIPILFIMLQLKCTKYFDVEGCC